MSYKPVDAQAPWWAAVEGANWRRPDGVSRVTPGSAVPLRGVKEQESSEHD